MTHNVEPFGEIEDRQKLKSKMKIRKVVNNSEKRDKNASASQDFGSSPPPCSP